MLVLDTEPVDDAPILDLRIRKGVRRNRVQLAVATSRPSSLDPNAAVSVRYAPGRGAQFAAALGAALCGRRPRRRRARRRRRPPTTCAGSPSSCSRRGDDVVILWGERLRSAAGAARPRRRARTSAAATARACSRCPPARTAAACARSGFTPVAGPGLRRDDRRPHDARDRRGRSPTASSPRSTCCTSTRCASCPTAARWERGLDRASTVIAHAAFLTEGLREHATVVFPHESHAEKEGTVVHPDGRLQRLRQAIAHQGDNRFEWQVIADVASAPASTSAC